MNDLSHIPGIRSICKKITSDPAYKAICLATNQDALFRLRKDLINSLIRKHCPSTLSITNKILIRDKIISNIEKMNL